MVNRFVTPQAILQKAREKEIMDRRERGFVGPIGSIQLNTSDTIKAFLDYFDEMEEQGWLFAGMCEYPDLPYGGCYVFRKENKQVSKPVMRKVESIDEVPLGEESYIEETKDEQVFDMYNEDKEPDPDKLMNANSEVINEVLFRQKRIIPDEEDPYNLLDDLAKGVELETVKEDEPTEKIRSQLYSQYEEAFDGKKAIFRGKETKQFKVWLDEQKAEYDPNYKQYKAETGELALSNEKETPEFIEWFRKKNESR